MNASARPVIQCSTGPFWTMDLPEALDAIAAAGFSAVELMVTRDPRTQSPEAPLELAAERGLAIDSVHAPFLVLTKTVWGVNPLEKIRRGIELCAGVGASTLVVHPPHPWERSYARWVKEDLDELSTSSGVTVAVETMYPVRLGARRLEGYRWLKPEALAAASPAVVLDTSHVAVGGHDLIASYRVLASKLAHIHLSDNACDGRDGHLEAGHGMLPLRRLLRELTADGYAGGICLELSLSEHVGDTPAAVAALERSRRFVEQFSAQDATSPVNAEEHAAPLS
jgi:sugar phosphate isomerase/epimerase